MSSSPLRSSAIVKDKITNSLKPPLMKMWRSVFNMFVVLCVWSLRKSELWLFFSVFFQGLKLRLIFFFFCNQKMFGTRCLRKMSKDNRKSFKIHSSTQIVMHKFSYLVYTKSYPSKWAISITEMHCPIQPVSKLTQK